MMANDNQAKRNRSLVSRLKRSQIYRDYEQAFREITGLPINLRSKDGLELALRGDPNENPFCALMAGASRSCGECLSHQARVERFADSGTRTLKCFAGLVDSAVPIRVGEDLVGFLQTGQIMLEQPSEQRFDALARRLIKFGGGFERAKLKEAYFRSRILDRHQYESVLRLLSVFAQHLSVLSGQLTVRDTHAESPLVARARSYILAHHAENLPLDEVARAVNMSAFYFCKMFRKSIGMTFTEYLACVRVEKVKDLLLDPHKRISEAAFEAGFQSLSQFNRVFRRIARESPTRYRARLHTG